jgi:ribose/xylose/arabinose/galactoside ABC-type transport system permease subunit
MKNAIKIVRKNLANAYGLVESCIEDILAPYGAEGVTLNTHCDDSYAVVSEITPNNFKVVESVRFVKDNLEMQFLGEKEWRTLCFVDMGFLVMFLGTFAGIACGALCGFINGMLITRLKLAPFIVTLGSMSVFRGISYLINDGKPFAVSSYTYLDTGSFCGIPSAVWLLIIVLTGAGFLLNKTAFGRYTYAVGSNVQTAFHAGINVNKVLVMIYTLAGALVGLAAMITTSRASSAQPSAGMGLELDIIAAVIIGGTSPSGGRGSISGTVIGTLLISFLRNGLTLLDISTNVQLVVIGLIIIFAVTADQIATRREASC